MVERPSTDELVRALIQGDRKALAQAITLVESTTAADRELAAQLLSELMPPRGEAYRVGITGAPGVGKSTFIDALGGSLLEQGSKVAVLSIDPTSPHSGGSILGDEIRMPRLIGHANAFVRPSPAKGAHGGVAAATAEAALLCEAAGYDVVLVETTGVGQQEQGVRHIVDFLLLLVGPGAGDEIQGLKRGLLEVVDAVAVSKADGELAALAEQTAGEYQAALRLGRGKAPAVLAVSALEGKNLGAVWQLVREQRAVLQDDGELLQRRSDQNVALFEGMISDALLQDLLARPEIARRKEALLERLQGGAITARQAALELVQALKAH